MSSPEVARSRWAKTPRGADSPPDTTCAPIAEPSARIWARIVDGVVAFLPALIGVPLGFALHSPTAFQLATVGALVSFSLAQAINLGLLHRYGQTIGKRIVGICIVGEDGERVPLSRLVWLRMLLPLMIELMPVVGPLFLMANMCGAVLPTRRCLHDHLARTIVVDMRTAVRT